MSELETFSREVLMEQLGNQVVVSHEADPLPVKLDHIVGLVKLYDKAVKDYVELGAEIEQLKATIQAAMGNAETATVKGVSTFTFNWKSAWRTTELKKDHGHLTKNYMVKQTVLKFDAEAFAKDHPTIARQYQTREFRRVSGTRNAVGR